MPELTFSPQSGSMNSATGGKFSAFTLVNRCLTLVNRRRTTGFYLYHLILLRLSGWRIHRRDPSDRRGPVPGSQTGSVRLQPLLQTAVPRQPMQTSHRLPQGENFARHSLRRQLFLVLGVFFKVRISRGIHCACTIIPEALRHEREISNAGR